MENPNSYKTKQNFGPYLKFCVSVNIIYVTKMLEGRPRITELVDEYLYSSY